MGRSSTANASTSRSYPVESYQGYRLRHDARDRRALVTGRQNCYPRMEYNVHAPMFQLFGCQDLSK